MRPKKTLKYFSIDKKFLPEDIKNTYSINKNFPRTTIIPVQPRSFLADALLCHPKFDCLQAHANPLPTQMSIGENIEESTAIENLMQQMMKKFDYQDKYENNPTNKRKDRSNANEESKKKKKCSTTN